MLTPRERAVARYFAMGLSPWRIGKAVHMRPENVRNVLAQPHVQAHVCALLDAQDQLAVDLVAATFFRVRTELPMRDMKWRKTSRSRRK